MSGCNHRWEADGFAEVRACSRCGEAEHVARIATLEAEVERATEWATALDSCLGRVSRRRRAAEEQVRTVKGFAELVAADSAPAPDHVTPQRVARMVLELLEIPESEEP